MDRKRRSASIVIASIVGPPFIDDCLKSVRQQAESLGAEVIVVACGTREYAQRLEHGFPWVRVIHEPERKTIPDLRRTGAEAAQGDIVAIIEEHCLAAPDWLERALAAFETSDCGVAGGPVLDYSYERLRDWVVYFCEYNNYFPPWREGEGHELGSANIAYSRALLMQYRDLLGTGYWEAVLHPRLAADGVKFHAMPTMAVHHRGPFDFGYYLGQRYWFSRAFAGARSRHLSPLRKIAYLIASPLIPVLLWTRMAQRVIARQCHVGKFAQALPLLVPVLVIYVAGEFMGYLAGPGDALLRVE
jgi:glycosyltransferase involved in cell wall biosynthesis